MRKDTKITKVYRLEELSDESQQHALEKLADINVDYEWWENVYEDAKNIGVKIEEFALLHRGAYCRDAFIRDELDVAEAILKEHGLGCETYKDAYEFVWNVALAEDAFITQWIKDNPDEAMDAADAFDLCNDAPELADEFRWNIFEDYRILLQQEYDYLTSKEAIKNTIDANEYEFTEDGQIYR